MSGILSLCTGYGGLDLAVEAVTGARTVAVSDLDKGANKILAYRFPDVPNLGDLKTIDWAAWAGTEVMTAGYPCQPFSHAGKREGTDDPRHIFPFIADGIRVVGPRLVVLENVRGHLALGFDTVLGTLADIGYDARWVCLRASDVGAPHRRERMFIVATPNAHGAGRSEHGRAVTDEAELVAPQHVGDAVQDAHGSARDQRGVAAPGQAEGGRARPDAGRRGGAPAADATGHGRHEGWTEPARLVGRPDAAERSASPVDWGQYGPAIARWSAVLGRPAPAPTEPGAKGQPRLSPRFVEFMMGLPEGWVTDVPDLSRNEQLKALGNGVVPQQAAAALTFLLNAQEKAA